MKMHNALTARPVIDRLDDLLGACRPPANPEPQRILVLGHGADPLSRRMNESIVAAIDLDAPAKKAKREQPTRRAGLAVPKMPPLATSPWTQRVF